MTEATQAWLEAQTLRQTLGSDTAVCPWVNDLTSLCCSFPVYKMKITVVLASLVVVVRLIFVKLQVPMLCDSLLSLCFGCSDLLCPELAGVGGWG